MFELRYFRGRVALSKILLEMGVAKGDSVAIQAFTCTAVPEAVLSVGAKPVYVDTEEKGVNMAPKKLEAVLAHNPAIKAVVVQHTFGIPAQIEAISQVVDRFQIPLIEDCAHTFKSKINGQEVGSWGVASFFSFEWGKPLIAGIGGSLASKDDVLIDSLQKDYKLLSEPGLILNLRSLMQIIAFKMLYHPRVYWILKDIFHLLSKYGVTIGNYSAVEDQGVPVVSQDFGMKMPLINRLLLNYSLSRLEKDIIHRKTISDYCFKVFSRLGKESVNLPFHSESADIYYARFPVLVEDKKGLLQAARKYRYEISGWYETPVHPLDGKQLNSVGYAKNDCPNAEKMCGSLVSFPVNMRISKKDVDGYFDFINNFFG